ncbi:MAG: site-2 protease family protein [Firmicutes bacterium]|nr:site-2 protease family protein [Bacillota bacterium]
MPSLIPDITYMLISLPAIVIGFTFHEYAHAKVADWLGDPTPAYQGRLTLNPLAHIDVLGFILLLFAGFGWAKPVQINPLRFRGDRSRGIMLVSLAGPLMNIVLAFIGALIYYLVISNQAMGMRNQVIALELLRPLIRINVVLAAFNLIPVPPLDGSKILAGLLPGRQSGLFYTLETHGTLILLVLIATGAIGWLLNPLTNVIISLISTSAHSLATVLLKLL